jgi:hypothetical protein
MHTKRETTRKFTQGEKTEVVNRQVPDPTYCPYCCRSVHRISALEQATVALNGMIGELKQELSGVKKEMSSKFLAIADKLDSIHDQNERREKRDIEIAAELSITKERDVRREIREKKSMEHLETMLKLLRASMGLPENGEEEQPC